MASDRNTAHWRGIATQLRIHGRFEEANALFAACDLADSADERVRAATIDGLRIALGILEDDADYCETGADLSIFRETAKAINERIAEMASANEGSGK